MLHYLFFRANVDTAFIYSNYTTSCLLFYTPMVIYQTTNSAWYTPKRINNSCLEIPFAYLSACFVALLISGDLEHPTSKSETRQHWRLWPCCSRDYELKG